AEKFLPNPFAERAGERVYRTGDLVRLGSDGNIEFLGRIDHQVKVRGFRIEPSEVEARLNEHPLVQTCVVNVVAKGQGDARLIAYWVMDRSAESGPSNVAGVL